MRRLLALLLMLVLPLQSVWSATAGVHGHLDAGARGSGVHTHDHDYHDAGHADRNLSATADPDNGAHIDDGHHASHCHHVLSAILIAPGSALALAPSDATVGHPPPRFHSHIPLPLDRPPLTHA